MNIHAGLLMLLLLSLALIAYQDFKHRSVPIYIFILACCFSILIQYQQCGFNEAFFLQVFLNFSFIVLNVAVVYIYIKRIKKIAVSQAIGLGDLVFYGVLIPVLSTPVFVYFHLLSLILILISYPFLKNILSFKTRAIPLAGLQALCLLICLIVFETKIINKSIIGTCSIMDWI
jgi:hypothetical protein